MALRSGSNRLFVPALRRAIPPRSKQIVLGLAALLAAVSPAAALLDSPRTGAPPMLEPHTASLLVDYYEAFLKDKDIDAFRKSVQARYTEGTLCRMVLSGTPQAKRAAVLALGLFGTYGSNDAVGRSLRDADPVVRSLAQNALWAIWFRADGPENNALLQQVADLNGRERYAEAVDKASGLIARAPKFAEAYNQRAIALYFQDKFAESAADCNKVLELNPYHFGALSGLVQCQMGMGQRLEALKTCRRALKLQPYNQTLRDAVAKLEAEGA
jgi:tetratricopeptide (TPR) repeat protein